MFFQVSEGENYPALIVRHDVFWSSRQVLEGKARVNRMNDKGKVPNRAKSVSGAEENILWESWQLGCNYSRSFIQTVWWNNYLEFFMRGRKEYYSLTTEHFHLENDANGRHYISCTEVLTKTRNKGLNFKPCLISPKMYKNKTERYPVAFFLLLKSKCPVELQNMDPFYLRAPLAVIDAPLTDVWYKNQAMGFNTINKMLSRMKKSRH